MIVQLLAVGVLTAVARAWEQCQDAASIKQRLLDNYGDSNIRPSVAVPPIAVDTVLVQVYVERFDNLHEKPMNYEAVGYLRTWWRDRRLAFTSNCTTQLSLSRAESRRVWRPDVYWEQSIAVQLPSEMPNTESGAGTLLKVDAEGNVWASDQATFLFACRMNFADVQPSPPSPLTTQE